MRRAFRIGFLVVVLGAAAVFAVVARADDPRFDPPEASLAPSFVNAGSNVLYTAKWHYIDSRTLVHASVVITVPDVGWTVVPPTSPAGCSQSGLAITCDWGTIRPDDTIEQQVELMTSSVLGPQTVRSKLIFYEGPNNPGRAQFKDNEAATTLVISADQTLEPDRAGACVPNEGGMLSTLVNHGGSSTIEDVPSTTGLCTPATIDERARTSPTEACLADVQCTTDIVTTNAPEGSVDHPIQLTITFYGNGLNNLPLIFNGGQFDGDYVDACTVNTRADPDPCYSGHTARRQSVTWNVNWSGRDPTWDS